MSERCVSVTARCRVLIPTIALRRFKADSVDLAESGPAQIITELSIKLDTTSCTGRRILFFPPDIVYSMLYISKCKFVIYDADEFDDS